MIFMLGIRDLKPRIQITQTSVECPVMGCSHYVERQRRSFKREDRFRCPEHKIYISPTTFEYDNEVDNLLWKSTADLALLETIKTEKRESRIARDNSEDALSWNVFRYFETTQQLAPLLSWMTQSEQQQPELIYWSYSQQANGAWPPLNKARNEFGENLQRSSEPDLIAVSEKALFFIEAKLTATNNTVPSNKHNRLKYLSGGDEWWKQVLISDYETVAIQAKKYELFRFWLLGSWLAKEIGRDFYLINIVLSEREANIEQQFSTHIRKTVNRHFKRISWEGIGSYVADNAPVNSEKSMLLAYFENKTIGYTRFGELQRAFSENYPALRSAK
jgi:hypothetical protein